MIPNEPHERDATTTYLPMEDVAMTPHDILRLGDAAVDLIERHEWQAAEAVLSTLFALGFAPPPLVAGYALVLSELDRNEEAQRVHQHATELCDSDNARAFVERLRTFLPEGKLHKGKREALQRDAERWLPRGPKNKD